MFEARLYKKISENSVECYLCRHKCKIKDGGRGICMVRENKGGTLYSVLYGKLCATAVDPIEKKPLFHFYPGSKSFSLATLGCNFQCEFCQNWDISQRLRSETRDRRLETRDQRPETVPNEIVDAAHKTGCKTIAYTYTEPTIFYEYARDVATIAKPKGIENIFVTNGFMTREMLSDMRPLLSAANVDLKTFNKETYKKIIKGDLSGVLDSISYMKELGIWIEVTTLIVPGMNDSTAELKQIASFIASIGKDIPWHISRFHPQYKMDKTPATPAKTLARACDIGREAGLKYVYVGNLPGDDRESTFCWNCNEKLIERFGFDVGFNKVSKDSTCPKCGSKIDGIGLGNF